MKSTGFILNGKYYKKEPNIGLMKKGQNPMYKQWDLDRQRMEHRFDLIQPYKDGKLNPEFIEHYPEEAKKYGAN
jgi:hypothetical protein